MNTLQLLRHGQRVRIEYAPLPGETEGAVGTSTEAERPGGQTSGIIRRYRKSEEGTYNAHALGWIKAVYADAIEYASVTKELKGLAFSQGLFYGLVVGGAGIYIGVGTMMMSRMISWYDLFFVFFGLAILTGSLMFGAYMLGVFMRADLFRPSDLPIIFDRKHRKVYRILREEHSGFTGAFKRWPLVACEYDWDLVDAEHQADVYTTGGTVSRNHFLMFLVRKSKDDASIIDSFQIASAHVLSDGLADSMWEHIRRFMEENGPHLPAPDEPLASMEPPGSWWQSMGAVGPFGPNYIDHWRKSPYITLALHLLFPVTMPLLFLWGTGNWLSYKTAIPVDWPAEVLAAVGPKK